MRTVEINTNHKTYKFIMDSKEAETFFFEFTGIYAENLFINQKILRVVVSELDNTPSAKFCWIRGVGYTMRNGAVYIGGMINHNPTFNEYMLAINSDKEYLDAQK